MDQVLTFRLENELYGLEVDRIQEVLQSPPLHYIPRTPPSFLGSINVHGSPRTVLDLARFLEFAAEVRDPRIVVLTPSSSSLAFSVTQLERIVPLDPEQVFPRQEGAAAGSCIRSVLQLEEQMINLLDLDLLLQRVEEVCETGGAP